MLFTSVTIGQNNYVGFGFATLNWKPLYHVAVVLQRRAKKYTKMYNACAARLFLLVRPFVCGVLVNIVKFRNIAKCRSITVHSQRIRRPVRGRGGGGCTPYNVLYLEATPERGTFFRLEVYKMVTVEIY